MSFLSTRPHVEHLQFCFLQRSVHPELFAAQASAEWTLGPVTMRFSLTDAGHVAEVVHLGRGVATEVVTSLAHPLPATGLISSQRILGSRNFSRGLPGGLEYQMTCHLEELAPEVFLTFHQELLEDFRSGSLTHAFPLDLPATVPALSLLKTDHFAGGLLYHVFHTFPESLAVVKTQALIEF